MMQMKRQDEPVPEKSDKIKHLLIIIIDAQKHPRVLRAPIRLYRETINKKRTSKGIIPALCSTEA
jgi:hypothetical protein